MNDVIQGILIGIILGVYIGMTAIFLSSCTTGITECKRFCFSKNSELYENDGLVCKCK